MCVGCISLGREPSTRVFRVNTHSNHPNPLTLGNMRTPRCSRASCSGLAYCKARRTQIKRASGYSTTVMHGQMRQTLGPWHQWLARYEQNSSFSACSYFPSPSCPPFFSSSALPSRCSNVHVHISTYQDLRLKRLGRTPARSTTSKAMRQVL